jgi:nucleoside-diphosphate-sugar epimerase
MKIAITGSSGYIGVSFSKVARSKHHQLIHLARHDPRNGEQWKNFNLTNPEAILLPSDVDTVVHLAFNPQSQTDADRLSEVESAKRLIEAAKFVGARVVFVSSQTAQINAPTLYGRIKWEIERIVLAGNGIVVRPGQVYGGPEMGLFGSMVSLVRRLPVLPNFLPSPLVQPVHVDDISEALLRVAEKKEVEGRVFQIAQSEPLGFTEFLQCIAIYRIGVRKIFVPVPISLINMAIKCFGAERSNRLQLSRLQSLFELPKMETEESLNSLQLNLRPIKQGIGIIDNPETLLCSEARVILCYVLKAAPDESLIERYVDAIKQCRFGRHLDMPKCVNRWPVLLALFDDPKFLSSNQGAELAWRLDAATLIAEASTEGAKYFLGVDCPAGFVRRIASLVQVVCMEVFWRIACFIIAPTLLRRTLKRGFQ